jgi:hypothetical protein
MLERSVPHRLEQPGRETLRLAALVKSFECDHERFLGDVLGVGGLADDA